ncbi:hypothetical protein [Bacillus licheniformis]|uniref:hypothetical protein n=1 Tax=Bacillus licheniformis TaxID=1402 RepID=UPI00237CD3EC|nr:hypothetical protein [Bacillus licheniformis]MDE1436916.1 hypothetical protein [Bacillus licheniformis]
MIRRSRRRHFVVTYDVREGNEKGFEGIGRIFVSSMRKNRISPIDIERMEEKLEKEYGSAKVIITNYQYF